MTAKKPKDKKSGGSRKRLSEEQKIGIAREPEKLTLAKFAEKYDTSIPTVSKYRKGRVIPPKKETTNTKKASVTKRPSAGTLAVTIPIQAAFDSGCNLNLNITRKELLKMLAETER